MLTRLAPPGPSELIPTPNLDTSQPDEVYPRESLIPSDEWSAISVSELLKATDDKERVAVLPYRRSRWIEAKMRSIINGPPAVRKANLCVIPSSLLRLAFLPTRRSRREHQPATY